MTDHSEFIARYHHSPSADPGDEDDSRKVRLSVAISLAIIYIAACIGAALAIGLSYTMITIVVIVFLGALMLSLFIQNLASGFSQQEKERQLLKEVIEGSRGARLITDGADNAVYTNSRFDELSPEAHSKGLKSLTDIFSNNPEALTHFKKLADQAHRGLTDSVELKAYFDGKKKWYSVTAQPVSGWAGYIHWRLDDITEKLKSNRQLREEREKLIDFTDNAPVGFFSVDENGRFVFVNGTLARWLGEDLQNMLYCGRLHHYLVNPPQNAESYDIIDNGGDKQIAEHKMKGPSGKAWLASINQTVVKHPDGSIRTRGVVNDLTSEKAMHQALQASEDKFQKFFEEAPLGIIIVSGDGILEDCNASFAQLLGTDIKDIEGKALKDIVEERDKAPLLEALDKIEHGKQMPAPLEISLLNKQGEKVITRMYARRFKGGENTALHFIDLTQQKNLEAQFVQSQKMQAIGQLAGGVAHDFNNLLTAMTGFCDLLLLRHKPGDPSFGDIMQIKQNANRAANLVRQLLAFSRQQTLRTKVQDITEILTEVSHLLRRLLGANIELELVHAPDLDYVKVDEGQIEQVLINLAVNARDAMEGSGKLTITTRLYSNNKTRELLSDDMPPGDWVVIDVTDTGSGIDKETLRHILEPFFTTKEVGQGTGLGLATVYGIIRQTGGYLDVKTKVNEGSTFSIYLPAIAEADEDNKEDRVEEDKKTKDLTGTARILLVEDEDAVRTFSSRALSNKGYEVLTAETGEAAVKLLEKEDLSTIDLLITDVIMPNMDGPALAQRLRQENPELKIIFMSGYTEEKLKDQVDDDTTFLPKPFSLKKLAETVKDVLDN